MANVLLLRAPTQEAPDRYHTAFESTNFSAVSVPVLETVLTNTADLTERVKKGPLDGNIGGVIVTSARACEAWRCAMQRLHETSLSRRGAAEWKSIPFYVVGKATASALHEIAQLFPESAGCPADVRGESSGTGEKLARFILQDLKGSPTRLLFLTGDKNKDILPNILADGGMTLETLQVYGTQGSSTFPQDLQEALDSVPKDDETLWWIVFFAPSAAEFVMPTLRKHFTLRSQDIADTAVVAATSARVAAIGPTTSSFLQDKLGIQVDAIPAKPTAEDLVAALLRSSKRQNG